MKKKLLAASAVSVAALLGLSACGYDYGGNEELRFNESEVKVGAGDLEKLKKEDALKQGQAEATKVVEAQAQEAKERADIKVLGDEVKNLRENIAKNANDFCKKDSKLKAGEGKEDKGGTCVSTALGEIAKNPIKVALPDAPAVIAEGQATTFKVIVEDKFGPLDLNAFTNKDGKAAETFLEHPGELDNDGRPLLHAHFGVTTLKSKQGTPVGNNYDAAFSGVQGVKGDLKVELKGLKAGFYRADVYAGGPGHAPTPTAKADQVQAFASVYFEVK